MFGASLVYWSWVTSVRCGLRERDGTVTGDSREPVGERVRDPVSALRGQVLLVRDAGLEWWWGRREVS